MKINKKFIFYLVLLFFLCISVVTKSLQNDVFYMIKLGKDILKYGIDMKDHYSFVSNFSYTYPHWMYDVFIYFVYKNFGFFGIFLSSIIFYFCLVSIIFSVVLHNTKNYFYSFFTSFFALFSVSVFVSGRSMLITGILFFLEVYFINKEIKNGKNRYIFFLALISFFIANLHGTVWLFYFILFLPFFVTKLVYYLLDKYSIKYNKKFIIEDVKNIKKLFLSFVLGFGVGLFTPTRICYSYVFRIMLGNTQSYIQEHAPLVVIHEPMFVLLMVVLLFVLIFSKCKIKLEEFFMLCGLILMSLLSIRHLIFFYTIGLTYISFLVFKYLKETNNITFDIIDKFIMRKIIMVLLFVFIVLMSVYGFKSNFEEEYVDKKSYPVGAVKYIKNNMDYKNIRMYNDYNFGSYLLFNDIPVFIDSRSDLYTVPFNGKYDVFGEYVDINKKYRKVFKKYNINYVLINKDISLNYILKNDTNYNVIYQDKYYILYEKK